MDRPSYSPALVMVVCVLGFLVAVAFNTARGMAEVRPERASDLVDVVRDLEMQRVDLQARLGELRARMDEFDHQAAVDAGVNDSFTTELETVRAAAGLAEARGSGVRIVLGDGVDVPAGSDPNDYLIHDTDLAAFVNALCAGGAKAIDINGERVVASTPIRCAGTTILVNSVRLGAPYTIRAIGDEQSMRKALEDDHTAALILGPYQAQFGLAVEVTSDSSLVVAPYKGSMRPVFALGQGVTD